MKQRAALAAMFTAAAVCCWVFLFDDASSTGTAVLGGYRDRWFLLCLLVTYACLWTWGLALRRPGRPACRRILSFHLGMAVSFIALEATALFGIVDFRSVLGLRDAPIPAGASASVHPRLTQHRPPHVRFSTEVLPNLVGLLGAEALPIPVVFQTDAHGLRNKSTKPDPDIVFLGDSILVAGLVPIDEIVSERVERALGVSVLNVSDLAYSPQEELSRLESLALPARDRLVVHFIFEGNDLADSRVWRARANHPGSSAWPASGFVKSLLAALHGPKRAAGARRSGRFVTATGDQPVVHFLYDSRRIDANIGEFSFIARAIQGAARDMRAGGGRYAVVFVPMKLRVLHGSCSWGEGSELSEPRFARSSFLAKLAEACAAEEIPLLDLTPGLEVAARGGRLPYFAADTHLNPFGHGVMAEVLGPWITAQDR
ncbi:MAG: hypothetical protein V3T22_08465 [Planctomycetota bacterium]